MFRRQRNTNDEFNELLKGVNEVMAAKADPASLFDDTYTSTLYTSDKMQFFNNLMNGTVFDDVNIIILRLYSLQKQYDSMPASSPAEKKKRDEFFAFLKSWHNEVCQNREDFLAQCNKYGIPDINSISELKNFAVKMSRTFCNGECVSFWIWADMKSIMTGKDSIPDDKWDKALEACRKMYPGTKDPRVMADCVNFVNSKDQAEKYFTNLEAEDTRAGKRKSDLKAAIDADDGSDALYWSKKNKQPRFMTGTYNPYYGYDGGSYDPYADSRYLPYDQSAYTPSDSIVPSSRAYSGYYY